jgi:biotin carboxyl carrier protein
LSIISPKYSPELIRLYEKINESSGELRIEQIKNISYYSLLHKSIHLTEYEQSLLPQSQSLLQQSQQSQQPQTQQSQQPQAQQSQQPQAQQSQQPQAQQSQQPQAQQPQQLQPQQQEQPMQAQIQTTSIASSRGNVEVRLTYSKCFNIFK